MSKTALWDRLGKTDPKHTKGFKRSGGFSGTAIKPIYSYRRMTEEFGPCGTGWGIQQPSFQTVAAPEGEVLVYCTVGVWHGAKENLVFGVGGDKAVGKNKYGIVTDDEAFKKAFTDAITNALKMIGVGADVHMGLFEDAKYVNSVEQELAAADSPASVSVQERQDFMHECRTAIGTFTDAEQLLLWWGSDAQKQARRDYQLDKSQVEALKTAVVDHRARLVKKAA